MKYRWTVGFGLVIFCGVVYNKTMSKAAEILRALNSQIQHPLQQKQEQRKHQEKTKVTEAKETDRPVDNAALQPKGQETAQQKQQENVEAPQCLTELLQEQLSSALLKSVFNNVESMLRKRQKNAYDSYTKDQNEYLRDLVSEMKQKEHSLVDEISGLMSARHGKVEEELDEGKLMVQHQRNISNKKQLERLEKIDRARRIKIKDGELRSKMDILHHKMEQLGNIQAWDLEEDKHMAEELQKKLMENMDASNYALQAQKTKIAKDYVRHMQQQRIFFEKRRKEREAKLQQQQQQRQAQLKEAEGMRDMAKKQEAIQRIEQRHKKRQEEEKQEQERQERAKKMLAQYHRKQPIFKIKQKQFEEKYLKPQQKIREQKLNEIRQNRRSMSLNEIKQHQEKYLSKLSLQRAKREQEYKMVQKARLAQQKKKEYYKGSAHARIQQMTKQDVLRSYSLRQASKLKAHRMKEYGDVINKNHPPTVDQEKKKQMVKLIETDLMRKKHARKVFKQVIDESTHQVRFQPYYEEIPQKDAYKQGNKYFQEARKHIKRKEKSQKTEESPSSNSNSAVNKVKLLQHTNGQPQKKTQNVWEIRAKHLQEMASSEVIDAKNFQHVKKNIQNLDSKAALKQELLKRIDLSIDEHIQEKGMLDNYYLRSIQQKMKLLE